MTSTSIAPVAPGQPRSSRRIRAFDPFCVRGSSCRTAFGAGCFSIGHPRGSRTETHVAILRRPPSVSPSIRRPRRTRGRGASRAPAPRCAPASRPARAVARGDDAAFKTDADGQVVPDVRAAAAIVFNPVTGQVLYEENSQDKRSIASITKVMTALVYLEDSPI